LYATAAIAGYVVELVFGALGWQPARSSAHLPTEGITLNYTTWLNVAFLVLAVLLLIRFTRTGGVPMLRMMGGTPDHHDHDHDHPHAQR
jgi:hypothetical protein